jgi:hypothetical protein
MTTTPETVAELKRLLAESTPRNGTLIVAAVNALPSLLDDLEAAQKREQVLRAVLEEIADSYLTPKPVASRANAALAATEVK